MLLKPGQITTARGLLAGVVMLAGSSCLAESKPNLQEGLWEVTSEMEMMGMAMPAMKHNQCITRENAVPVSAQQDQECKMINTAVNGDTVSWNMVCESPEGQSNLAGEITYHGDTFNGMLNIDLQGIEMTQHMSGRRIGECGN